MEISTTLESLIENKQYCIFVSYLFLVGSGCVEQRIEGLTEFDKIKRKNGIQMEIKENKKQKKLDPATIKCQLTRS